jgi:type VI secretion system protein
MKKELSLLDRLDNSDPSICHSTAFDWHAYLDSVVVNIQKMLNVRMGSVTALEQFGMPDFNDVVNQFPDAVLYIRNSIQHFIEDYEPRLESVNVYYIPDADQPLLLKYGIEGRLRYEQQVSKVMFDTVLTGSGQAMVRV